ncbi:MAG: HAMP domain-containing sensor histidine kinase [Clostridia bacterium]|nr:HAMP domain-containing sensor histidine kinase [Clostridia bacterium]
MKVKKRKFKSIKTKLLVTFTVTITIIILFFILVNSIILEPFYIYSKTREIKKVYNNINTYYNGDSVINLEEELKKSSIKNNFDILLKTNQDLVVISLDKDAFNTMEEMISISQKNINLNDILVQENNLIIQKTSDTRKSENYILLTGRLDNGYILYIRIAISSIQESVKISNQLLIFIGVIAMFIAGSFSIVIAKKFTKPILELNDIAQKLAGLDFEQKYSESNKDEDEINTLGRSINKMSDKLRICINELKETNIELERDIEEKSKIDEMRKQFISDVSHELKTPIALIQGYSEGLIENVNSDEESKNYYAGVILDESKKMDTMVKKLLDLLRIEYSNQELIKEEFDIIPVIEDLVRKYDVVMKQRKIDYKFSGKESVLVYAERTSIEQVLTNYFVNAIKYIEKVDDNKFIEIFVKEETDNRVRIGIFNTGKNIEVEEMDRIWKRFYKIDKSRNREKGGSGIGLSIVRAIMNNYGSEYGVENKENGVEFYFYIDKEFSR